MRRSIMRVESISVGMGPLQVESHGRTYDRSSPELKVKAGQITFDVEGNEGKYLFSRVMHKPPGNASGVTIGRGYDMGSRTQKEVYNDLIKAGVPELHASIMSKGAGKKGVAAERFLQRVDSPVISLEAQKKLFEEVTYPVYVKRAKEAVCKYEGMTTEKWDKLPQKMRDILVDFAYRGDLSKASRRVAQAVAQGDTGKFKAILSDENFWKTGKGIVADDRSKRRIAHLR